MINRVQRVRLKSYFQYLFCTWITYIVTSTTATMETVTNPTLDCTNRPQITSPGYPSRYENNIFIKWYIDTPRDKRILVTFNYFSLDSDDFMYAIDGFAKKKYTGENMQFPPYLATGLTLQIEFASSPRGRRKGFNISVSCHEPPTGDNISVRLMGGIKPSEGFIELSASSGEWMRVCKESFTDRVAEVICGELGYPGVKNITIVNVNTQNCTRAPSCGDDTYRLVDCTAGNSSCQSNQVVKIICHEPGYRGCYELQTQQLQNSSKFAFSTASQCIYLCKSHEIQTLALMNENECFCSSSAEVNFDDLSTCDDHSIPSAKFSIYDASVGFCEELNDMIGGSWDSNITWFGSIVHLTCMDGYTLKGNGTIQCVPGVTPYYPIWNDSIPECELRVSDDCTYILLPVLIGSTVVLFLILLAVAIGWVIPQIWKYCSSNSKIIHTNLALQDRTPTHHVNLPVTSTISGASAVALINTTSPGKVGDDHNSIIYETIPSSNVDNGGYFSDSDVDAFGYVLPNPPKILKDETFMHEKEMIGGKSKTLDMLEDEKGYLVPNVHNVCK